MGTDGLNFYVRATGGLFPVEDGEDLPDTLRVQLQTGTHVYFPTAGLLEQFGVQRRMTEPFPGSDNFKPDQIQRLARIIDQMRELQPQAVMYIAERDGVGWLPNGFGDTRGILDIENAVRARCRAVIALETAYLLGEPIGSQELVHLIVDDSVFYEDMPGRVHYYLSQRKERPSQ